jgi:hypothetical protein
MGGHAVKEKEKKAQILCVAKEEAQGTLPRGGYMLVQV